MRFFASNFTKSNSSKIILILIFHLLNCLWNIHCFLFTFNVLLLFIYNFKHFLFFFFLGKCLKNVSKGNYSNLEVMSKGNYSKLKEVTWNPVSVKIWNTCIEISMHSVGHIAEYIIFTRRTYIYPAVLWHFKCYICVFCHVWHFLFRKTKISISSSGSKSSPEADMGNV